MGVRAREECATVRCMDAAHALTELTEVSPQVRAAVVVTTSGEMLAAVGRDTDLAGRLAPLARDIDAAVERARKELDREPAVQCEIATGEGNVFFVRDEARIVLAVTRPAPTVGLVFYDLKTVLRTLREGSTNATSDLPSAGKEAR